MCFWVEEVTIDCRQCATAQDARLFQTQPVRRCASRSQPDTRTTGCGQVDLDHVKSPWAVDQIDGMMPHPGGKRLCIGGDRRPLATCQRGGQDPWRTGQRPEQPVSEHGSWASQTRPDRWHGGECRRHASSQIGEDPSSRRDSLRRSRSTGSGSQGPRMYPVAVAPVNRPQPSSQKQEPLYETFTPRVQRNEIHRCAKHESVIAATIPDDGRPLFIV